MLLPSAVMSQLSQVTFDSLGLKVIKITHADSVVGFNDATRKYQSLIGAVGIEHDGVIMTCDSAHFYQDKNMVEAFSNVHISKANGANAMGDYIRYTGDNNTAFMRGAVQIIDGKNTLQTEELTYNIKTKIGKYANGGNLQNNETTITSQVGTYNGFTEQAYFVNDVIVTNPKYNITSKELTYNSKTEIVKFLNESEIVTENSTIHTKSGTYNSKTSNAVFTSRTTVENEDQKIEGDYITYDDKSGSAFAKGKVIVTDIKNNSIVYSDTAKYNKQTGNGSAIGHVYIVRENGKNTLVAHHVDYNKKNGYAKAVSNVILEDTTEHTKLLAGVVEFNENSKFLLATKKPKLITVNNTDTLYLRADTILTMREKDRTELKQIEIGEDKKSKEKLIAYNLLYADSTYRSDDDSTTPKLILAFPLVRMFSDSMQVVCDSLSYSGLDSMFRFYQAPILWSKNEQAVADTIFGKTVNNKLSEANLKLNAFLISKTGYDGYFDQVNGNFIDAFFENNQIKEVYVNQNARSIYYAKDEQQAYIGLNQCEASSMNVYFKIGELDHIVMHENPKGEFKPIDKIQESDRFLDNFKLWTERKPKNKEDILEN